jgi:ferritin-like metal-binding protein YciE
MKLNSLHDLLVEELRDLYSAENMLLKALPRMAKAASSEELQAAFEEHLTQTEEQVRRLDRIFKQLGAKAKGKKCKAMEGLIEEGKEIMEQDGDEAVLDAAMIGAAQKVEHYEIASYGTARTFAQILGLDDVADLLQETLDEEADTDKRLTEIAESANYEAATVGGEDEEE